MTPDPHAALRRSIYERVFLGDGEAAPELRQAAGAGTGVPADLQPLIDKIHRHAYKVTDEDIARVQAKYGDDKMFEIVVSAALGAARKRLSLGLEALDNA